MDEDAVELDPPLTQVAWAAGFPARSLETFFVYTSGGLAWVLRPVHAPSLLLGWGAETQPGAAVVEACRRYGLDPIVVHSTSWRTVGERLVLTYVAVVEPPASSSHHLVEEPVARSELARGGPLTSPAEIDVGAVIEHAFRHLRWLLDDDPVVHEALADWRPVLEAYQPEPFRAFAVDPPA